ncbi:phosphoribosylglycinamide formyltransferase [bacterium SCSIO 12741]|nr:phosphoribosylglycinamide formyltransferase [bacterium SCSIO 12741]
MKNLVVFASGTGSNARKIHEHFQDSDLAHISLIVGNKENAGVWDLAKENDIPTLLVKKKDLESPENLLDTLRKANTDLIVLAGFLLKIPDELVAAYPNQIINIHPSLLPKYGGKGMYGHFVHEAVVAAGEKESGITIHFVNEAYDEGAIITQQRCALDQDDTPQDVAHKVQKLEHRYFPTVVEELLLGKNG